MKVKFSGHSTQRRSELRRRPKLSITLWSECLNGRSFVAAASIVKAVDSEPKDSKSPDQSAVV